MRSGLYRLEGNLGLLKKGDIVELPFTLSDGNYTINRSVSALRLRQLSELEIIYVGILFFSKNVFVEFFQKGKYEKFDVELTLIDVRGEHDEWTGT